MATNEKIDNYLSNRLDLAEKIEFEMQMESDEVLKETVSKQLLATESIRLSSLKNAVYIAQNEYLNQTDKNEKKQKFAIFSNASRLKIAAVVGFFTISFALFQYSIIDKNQLIKNNTLPYIEPIMRSAEPNESKIAQLYNENNFKGLIQAYRALPSPSTKESFLAAMAFYNQKQYNEALKILQNIESQSVELKNSELKYKLEYYKAISQIGVGMPDQALEGLQNIKKNPENPYSEAIGNLFLLKLKILTLK
jgi:hypothetical protein